MRAILVICFSNCERQGHKTVSTNHNLLEEKGEPKRKSSRGLSAYQPNALPLGQTGSLFLPQITQCFSIPAREAYVRVRHWRPLVSKPRCVIVRPEARHLTGVHRDQRVQVTDAGEPGLRQNVRRLVHESLPTESNKEDVILHPTDFFPFTGFIPFI